MPKLADDTPQGLRPFVFHAVDITPNDGTGQATGPCPLCGRGEKFHVNMESGLWDCKKCAQEGNPVTFLRAMHEGAGADPAALAALADDRGLLDPQSLEDWGVCQSPIDDEWLVPGYSPDGALSQVYRYVDTGERHLLMPTPGVGGHGLHGVNLYDPDKPEVYLCEGFWDGSSLYEALRSAKPSPAADNGGPGLTLTGSESASLYAKANVLAVPGTNVWRDSWAVLFAGKRVFLCFDSDRPRLNEQTGKVSPPAGLAGMRRVAGHLAHAKEPPAEINYLHWGPDGYDDGLPDGYDVRDALAGGETPAARVKALSHLLGRLRPVPEGFAIKPKSPGLKDITPLPCNRWADLRLAWRKSMKWTDGLDRGLCCMLACAASTMLPGDQLWVKVLGPAACGKSTLAEALAVDKKHVKAVSNIRGFHSGYKSDAKGEEDHSLLAQLGGKTLITKDGDTLLQSPNLPQILAEARDLYDRTARSHYRSGLTRNYENLSVTWILCGTSSLRQIDSSELGERFLDVVIMEKIDPDIEDEILTRVANRVDRVLGGSAADADEPEKVMAMRLTGGYVEYLRQNAPRLLASVRTPPGALSACASLAKFTAYMRARPSIKQDESAERELATRLVSQLVRLAKCLAAVLNKKEVDDEVMAVVTRVARDTARGRTLDMVAQLRAAGDQGLETKPLAMRTHQTDDKARTLLQFLRRIGAVEQFTMRVAAGLSGRPRWRLEPRLTALYDEVVGPPAEEQE